MPITQPFADVSQHHRERRLSLGRWGVIFTSWSMKATDSMRYPCGSAGLHNKLIQALKKLVVTETVHLDPTLVQVLQHLPVVFTIVYHSKIYAHHSNLQYTIQCIAHRGYLCGKQCANACTSLLSREREIVRPRSSLAARWRLVCVCGGERRERGEGERRGRGGGGVVMERRTKSIMKYYSCTTCTATYTTVHYSTLQYTTVYYSTLQCTTVNFSILQYTTVHYSTLQYTTVHYSKLQYTREYYSPVVVLKDV